MWNFIKYHLRNNPLYIKYCQTEINNIRYFFKNAKLYIKKYSLKIDKNVEGNTLFFIIDPNIDHPGLADRLKVICCCFYIAKINNFDFKIIFEDPFQLSDYLIPNKINWKASFDDLSLSLHNSRLLAYNGGAKIPQLNPKIKQYHIYHYIGKNILQYNKISNWEKIWSECYHELFKPSHYLENILAKQGLLRHNYIAAHLRFVNALGNFEEGFYNTISEEQKKLLVNKCLNILDKIKKQNTKELVVFSDSTVFLEYAKKKGYKVLSGNIGHISFSKSQDTIDKVFVDFYTIGYADIVYRIKTKELYNTTFSYYASLVNGAKFISINE